MPQGCVCARGARGRPQSLPTCTAGRAAPAMWMHTARLMHQRSGVTLAVSISTSPLTASVATSSARHRPSRSSPTSHRSSNEALPPKTRWTLRSASRRRSARHRSRRCRRTNSMPRRSATSSATSSPRDPASCVIRMTVISFPSNTLGAAAAVDDGTDMSCTACATLVRHRSANPRWSAVTEATAPRSRTKSVRNPGAAKDRLANGRPVPDGWPRRKCRARPTR